MQECSSQDNRDLLRAREKAADLLGRRPLSVKMLGDKLEEKGFPEEIVSETLSWLLERHYLDDEEYAKLVIRSYTERGYGRLRIQQELFYRGISKELSKALLMEMPEKEEKIDGYIIKKLKGKRPERKEQKKVIDGLIRRGFTYEQARRGLERYVQELAPELAVEMEEAESWENELE